MGRLPQRQCQRPERTRAQRRARLYGQRLYRLPQRRQPWRRNLFQKFGLVEGPYWKFIEDPKHDKGRADVTKKAEDEFFFRVPGLRNVAKTYPYFHNGSVWELDKAVTIMGKAQLGKDLSKEDTDNIVAFLKTLSGNVSDSARTMPELPLSAPMESHPNNK